jgi:hypothetical protein
LDKSRIRRLADGGPREIAYAALAGFSVIALVVTVTAIVESYANLVAFGMAHGMTAWHGMIAPIAVDSFIVMGELLLFAGLLLHWHGWELYYAAFLVLGGFAMSVGGNIYRATPLPVWADRSVQAIWPITATAALTGCLIILKRLYGRRRRAPLLASPADPAPAPAPVPRREPRPVRAKARAPGPAAARDRRRLSADQVALEMAIARELVAAGMSLPGGQKLASAEPRLNGSRRAADRVLEHARTLSNGGGHGDRIDS